LSLCKYGKGTFTAENAAMRAGLTEKVHLWIGGTPNKKLLNTGLVACRKGLKYKAGVVRTVNQEKRE